LVPLDLLKTASDLLPRKGKPRQANLLRGISTVYYSLFHVLAKTAADLLIGSNRARKSHEAWQQVYRALDHNAAKKACQNQNRISLFPQEVQDFASAFVSMQEKRHKADYDPNHKVYKSELLVDIEVAGDVITNFNKVPILHRRAFAALLLFKMR
jgi:uncharacterized protein (UPF0332 family)